MHTKNEETSAYNGKKFDVTLCECHARTPDTPEDPDTYEKGKDLDTDKLEDEAKKEKGRPPVRKIDPDTGKVIEYDGRSVYEK